MSPDGSERWLNWIVVDVISDQPAGYLQATVRRDDDHDQAELAWVIGTRWQGRGFATEAARAAADWLEQQGITILIAHIRPGHRPSERVAESLGLQPSSVVQDGEIRWISAARACLITSGAIDCDDRRTTTEAVRPLTARSKGLRCFRQRPVPSSATMFRMILRTCSAAASALTLTSLRGPSASSTACIVSRMVCTRR